MFFCFHDISRAGHPDLDFDKAAEAEHCTRAGHDYAFTSTNYNITTTPEKEWGIVVKRDQAPVSEMGHGRRIPDAKELVASPQALLAGLMLIEVLAVILYTGPMVKFKPLAQMILKF